MSSSVPFSKSNAASPTFAGIGAPGGFHRNRPAIIEQAVEVVSPPST
jgi:hypothetical protein